MLELLLNVTDEMRDTKTRFWKALESNPICDADHVTLVAAEQLTQQKKLKAWWNKPGFVQWFTAGDEYEIKLGSAKFTAVDALMEILTNPDSPASARVAAAKLIMDHAKTAEKEDPALEKLLEKIAGVNNIEDLQRYIK